MKNSNRIEVGGKGKTYGKREVSCYEASPGRYVVQLTAWDHLGRADVTFYDVTPISGAQFGRAAFRFVKAASTAERPSYNVLLDGDRSTCDCPHGVYKAQQLGPCRHVLAAQALLKAGKLPAPARVVRVPAAVDGWRTSVPATVDAPAGPAADPGYQTCDCCGKPAERCECELVLA
jgi:hypothetical protein